MAKGWKLLLLVLLGLQAYWQLIWARQPLSAAVDSLDPRRSHLGEGSRRLGAVDRRGIPLIVNRQRHGRAERIYPFGATAAHVTGYHEVIYGKTGLEGAADRLLFRRPLSIVEVLAEGGVREPKPLSLTLDLRLQKVAEHQMARRRGAVVMLAPRSGDVLVLYSYPGFDPNLMDARHFALWSSDAASPFLCRPLQGLYPPGSVFKLVVAAAALQAGWNLGDKLFCPPLLALPGDEPPIRDHEVEEWSRSGREWGGHGRIDLAVALTRSANIYFAQMALEVGPEAILDMARQLGFQLRPSLVPEGIGTPALRVSASRLPIGESMGPGRTARLGIGQDRLLVTPFHVAWLTAALANRGVCVPPRLLLLQVPKPGVPVLDPDRAEALCQMMRSVVAKGTGRRARLGEVPVAGKTGTAENPHGAPHAWFTGFAPLDSPSVVVTVLIENGGEGGRTAAPVAAALLRAAREAGYL